MSSEMTKPGDISYTKLLELCIFPVLCIF